MQHKSGRFFDREIFLTIFKDRWIDGVKSVQNLPRQPQVFVGKCLIVSDKSPAEALPRESVRVKKTTTSDFKHFTRALTLFSKGNEQVAILKTNFQFNVYN